MALLSDPEFPRFNSVMSQPTDNEERARFREMALDLVWSDPALAEEEPTLDQWGFGPNVGRDSEDILIYGEKAIDQFLREHKFDVIIRAHEAKQVCTAPGGGGGGGQRGGGPGMTPAVDCCLKRQRLWASHHLPYPCPWTVSLCGRRGGSPPPPPPPLHGPRFCGWGKMNVTEEKLGLGPCWYPEPPVPIPTPPLFWYMLSQGVLNHVWTLAHVCCKPCNFFGGKHECKKSRIGKHCKPVTNTYRKKKKEQLHDVRLSCTCVYCKNIDMMY